MTNRITTPPKARTVIVGVDTHTHVHVAVAIDSWGIRLGDHAFVADSGGYEALVTWAETHGRIEAFGIEGTGSYGAGLARAVHRAGHHVVEVNRGDRRTRRAAGKSDTIDAEVAARSLLAGQSTAIPKTADGAVEMIRQAQDHTGYRHESAHHGDEHAEADHRAGPARPARSPSRSHRSRPAHALRRTPTGPHRHAHRVRQAHPPVARPSVDGSHRGNRRCTTSTSRVSPPRHHRPSARASVWAPTPRLSC